MAMTNETKSANLVYESDIEALQGQFHAQSATLDGIIRTQTRQQNQQHQHGLEMEVITEDQGEMDNILLRLSLIHIWRCRRAI